MAPSRTHTRVRKGLRHTRASPRAPWSNPCSLAQGERFAKNDHIGNRKLLWHGTNAAVVAAIMKGGMRIMPHSGGRVGRGIYLASENNKSAAYVQASPDAFDGGVNTGIMFLCEAALGEMKTITKVST